MSVPVSMRLAAPTWSPEGFPRVPALAGSAGVSPALRRTSRRRFGAANMPARCRRYAINDLQSMGKKEFISGEDFEFTKSKSLFRIQQNGHRPIVHQFHFHHLLKATRFTTEAGRAHAADESFVERARHLGARGVVEGRPLPLADISKQRELRHRQDRSADLRHRPVHLARIIFEDAEPYELVGQIRSPALRVLVANSQKHKHAPANFSGDLPCHRNLCPSDSLNDCAHVTKCPGLFCSWQARITFHATRLTRI